MVIALRLIATGLALLWVSATTASGASDVKALCDGKFGKAVDLSRNNRRVIIPLGKTMQRRRSHLSYGLAQLPQLRGVRGGFHAQECPLDPRFLHYIS